MKKICFSIITFLFSFNFFSQKDFYFYKNEKVEFGLDFQHLLFISHASFDIDFLSKSISEKYEVEIHEKQKDSLQIVVLKFSDIIDSLKYQNIVNELYKIDKISYATCGLYDDKINHIMYFSNTINVCLNEYQSKIQLEEVLKEFKVNTIKQNKFMKNWYSFSIDKNSKSNSSEICKILTLKNSFIHIEPAIINGFVNTCVNDEFFGDQWFLNNTGQNSGTVGVDIKICDAWNVTTGSQDIITAVVDEGVDLYHPDLIQNIYPISYDAYTDSSPSFLFGKHGTACSGIIASSSNNNLGVSGVAPNSKIMSISNGFGLDVNLTESLANSINFAAQNGASIISSSWKSNAISSLIQNAITNALIYGRNNLGCVVVFSAGNDDFFNSSFPGNSNPQIINVGAVDRCGIRSGRIDIITNSCDPWSDNSQPASSYGPTLDIVAGGSSIYTTDLQGSDGYDSTNYTSFGGTSAACPQVAGVAALILSVNPCLTQQSVHDIICFSGQKLSNYNFLAQTGTSRERLGSWNNEVGHGLVDANVCVNLAKDLFIQKQTISANEDFNFSDILMGSNVTSFKPIGNAVIDNNAISTITAKNTITLKKGTMISRGTTVLLKINPDLACNYSNPIKMNAISSSFNDLNELSKAEQNLLNRKFSFYPNPTNETLNIKINNKLSEKVKIEIYNVSGKMLYLNYLDFTENLNDSLNLNENNLNDSGIYFIKVSNSTFSDSYKIVKL